MSVCVRLYLCVCERECECVSIKIILVALYFTVLLVMYILCTDYSNYKY